MLSIRSQPPYPPNSLTLARLGFGVGDVNAIPLYVVAAIGDDAKGEVLGHITVPEVSFIHLIGKLYPEAAPHLPQAGYAPPPPAGTTITASEIVQRGERILQAVLLPLIKGRKVTV